MNTAPAIAIGVVAALHAYFLVVEMFLWTKPYGRRVFGLSQEFANQSRALAANQGLYNGFLAAGLVWSLCPAFDERPIAIFFLSCVIAAGIFGGITANKKILFVQALPGAVALVLLFV